MLARLGPRVPRFAPVFPTLKKLATFSTFVLTLSFGSFISTACSKRSFFTENISNNMQSARNDGMGGRGVTFTPTSGTYSNVVVWMHGLGDTADGWASMMPSLGIRDTKFIVPTAKSRPITINMGMPMPGMYLLWPASIYHPAYVFDLGCTTLGWFDIYDLDEDSPEDADGFADTSKRINAFIQAEIDKGVAPNRIVLAGFSQGGAVALHVSLRSEHSLGGCIALSTWLPFRSQYPDVLSSAATNLPVLQVHGDEDQVVSYPWGKGSHEVLKGLLTSPAPEFITIEVCQ